ncbi:peroxisomal copper amine oxidase [Amanita muscaria]
MAPTTTNTNVPSTTTTTTLETKLNGQTKGQTSIKHPLDPLTPEEINAISSFLLQFMIKKHEPEKIAIKFATCMLLPPPKRAVLAHLGIPLEPGAKPDAPTPIVRRAEVDLLDVLKGNAFHAVVSFKNGAWALDKINQLPEGVQPQITPEELIKCEEVVRADPTVQKLAKEVGIEPHQICCDGWAIGYDERFPKTKRIQQGLAFARLYDHDNLYAHPLDFFPIIDSESWKVIHIDFAPHYNKTPNGYALSVTKTAPPPLGTVDESLKAASRERIPPPLKSFDFLPDLMAKSEEGGYKPREGLKPLHISQPEGVSFTLDGHVLEWQGWKMHVAFSHREGIALSTITFNDRGQIRPVFYHLSLAEMVVPYAAPEHPHPRKFAFDSGEYGMGTVANELSLGCDCLGHITYMPGSYIGNSGKPVTIKNVICIHEEDAGVLWKHTDFRVGGRSQTVRRRRLVVSMVCTVANYEYIWNYLFYQDGSIELEIRLTGILQVYVSKPGEPNPYGTTVAPQVTAHHHQHLFCLRVDPMIDGLKNSLIETDVIPLPDAPTGSEFNHGGNAFIAKNTVIETEGGREWNYNTDRRWSIVNPGRKHYSSGKDVGYQIVTKSGATPLIPRPDSWIAKRASFLDKSIWVVREVEGEDSGTVRMWPAGQYVPQTRVAPEDSVGNWAQGAKKVDNEDILLFLVFGITHLPRPEDWPVMPVETLQVVFKPNSFFDKNPSMDIPGTNDNNSVLANGDAAEHSCH